MMKMRPAVSAAALAALCAAGSVGAQQVAPDAGRIIILPPEEDQPYVAPVQRDVAPAPAAPAPVAPIAYVPVLETPERPDIATSYSTPSYSPPAYSPPAYGAPLYSAPNSPPYYADSYRASAADIPYSATYERDAWLDYCRANYLDGNGSDRSGALGGLAGTGIGAAIDGDQRRERLDDCEIYLERTTGSYPRQPGPYYSTSVQPARGAAFYGTYGQQMVLVPVMVPIPQRAIVREYVTEEIID